MKVLFSSFAKNGHTAWFDPQTEKLEQHCITKQKAPHDSTALQRMVTLHRSITNIYTKALSEVRDCGKLTKYFIERGIKQ